MSEQLIITKMSVKGIGCRPGTCEPNKPAELCNIFGYARGIITGKMLEKKDGTVADAWEALEGDFMATNLQDGKVYRSGKLFLPGGIHSLIASAVKTDKPDVFNTVKFGLAIQSVVASNPIGYSYQAKNLLPPETADPLADLMKQIAAAPATAPTKK
jgi:hypothetical protein